jgi:acyl-coenzyme A synthetase/AMP-(fatty) acid ligase
MNRFAQRPAAALAAIAICAGGAVWTGCGSNDTSNKINKALDQSQKAIDQAQKKGQKAVNQATHEANKAVKEAKKQANDNGY